MHPTTIKVSSAFLGTRPGICKRIGIHTFRPPWHPPRRAQTSLIASQALYPHSRSKPPSFLISLTSAQTQSREAAPDRVRQTVRAAGQVPGLALNRTLAQAQAQPAQDPMRPYGSTLSAATDCTCPSSTAPAGSSTPSSRVRSCRRQKGGYSVCFGSTELGRRTLTLRDLLGTMPIRRDARDTKKNSAVINLQSVIFAHGKAGFDCGFRPQ